MTTLTLPRRTMRHPGLLDRLLGALEMHRSRTRLSELSDDLLRDVGLTRADATADLRRSVWEVPGWWR